MTKCMWFQAEENITKKGLDKEYAPISGSADFCKLSVSLALGDDNPHLKEGLVSNIWFLKTD